MPAFDEHRYGFHSFLEAVRHAQRAGLLRLERNRQGILRVFPGALLSQLQRAPMIGAGEPAAIESPAVPYDVEEQVSAEEPQPEPAVATIPEEMTEAPPLPEESVSMPASIINEPPVRKRRSSSGIKRKTVAPRKSAALTGKRPQKKNSTPPEEGSSS